METKLIATTLLGLLGLLNSPFTADALPVVTTLAATSINETSATLNGTVDPNGHQAYWYFEYGLTASYGTWTPLSAIVTSPATNSYVISNLTPGTTYHFQFVASDGSGAGGDLTLTTANGAPVVTTLAASGVTPTNATFNGTIVTGGLNTSAYFQYGLATNYGSFTATKNLAATNTPLSVTNLIGSLTPGTIYHFQLVASNSLGIGLGGDLTFTAALLPPVATSLAASGVSTTTATLNGTVNPGYGATVAYFQYGLTTSYGSYSATNSLPATNTTLSVSDLLTSLAPGTPYHYQLVAINADGIRGGGDLTFTTANGAPAVTTLAASGATETSATFNGTLTTGGLNSSAFFQYGTDTNYGSFSATNSLAGTNAQLSVSSLVGSLAGGTTYHFQLVAINSAGTARGGDVTFSTTPGVITLAATSVTDTNAIIHGTVKPNGYVTTVTTAYFQYGTDTNYGDIGGFTILPATNDTLNMSGLVVNSITGAAGSSWTQSNNHEVAPYGAIVSSADGMRMAAMGGTVALFTSADGGATWAASGPSEAWTCIASSADGMRLAAGGRNSNGIYTSTNGGSTWTLSGAYIWIDWSAIASSADGTRLVAGTSLYGIYTSTDGGSTWTLTSAPSYGWSAIASSADGTHLAAAMGGAWGFPGGIYTSSDGGATWTEGGAPASTKWQAIASSADGRRLAAAADTDIYGSAGIYTSTDGGATWTQTSAPTENWVGLASSADGSRLAASVYNGGIYTSTDGGNTWTLSGAPSGPWMGVASSADGTRLAAGNPLTGIFTSTGPVSALLPGTTCHYQLVGLNSIGTSLGGDLTFTTSGGPPLVANLGASSIAATNATLNGTVNPLGASTTVFFQYGVTTSYGSFSATNSLAATNSTFSVSNLIGSLAPGTTYHYQLVAINSVGTSSSADATFTTVGDAVAATLAASGITGNNATVNGTVDPSGGATTAYFQYGLTTSYGSFSATNSLAATNSTLSVSNVIGSLAPGTTYHYQLVAINSVGTSSGADATFTTVAVPVVTTLAASGITATNATLNGTVNPGGGVTTAYFQYGQTTNYNGVSAKQILSATNATLSVSSLIGLLPATTYHFRMVATNLAGTNFGGDLNFTTHFAPPAVTTSPASAITATTATLNGTVDPNNANTEAQFEYGLTTNYNHGTAVTNLGTGAGTLSVSQFISSLVPGTTYHFRIGAQNTGGSSQGADRTFTTRAGAPTVTTLAASGVTAYNATLNGSLTTGDTNTAAYFQYGTDTNYGNFSATNSLGAATTILSVSKLIGSLAPSTTYHFRLVATNTFGTSLGVDMTFTTAVPAPVVATLAASGITATNATLNGTVNPEGFATTAYFQYGTDTNYGSFSATNSLAATNTILSVSNMIGNLVPGTTYHFQLVGSNSVGTSLSADMTFTTSPLAPIVTTLAASGVTATNATLNGTLNPGGGATTAYFQYGLTTNYGSFSTTNSFAAGFNADAVSNVISGLLPATLYHASVVAANISGAVSGADVTFTTLTVAPAALTQPAIGITSSNATLNASINPGASASYYFQYGLTTNYGSFTATNSLAGTAFVAVSNALSGLAPGTLYHFQPVALNGAGATYGPDAEFATLIMPPDAVTLAAGSLTATGATLNATVDPGGAPTAYYFQFGLTTNYGSFSATNSLVAAGSALHFNGTNQSVSTSQSLNLANISFSVEFWAKRDGLNRLDLVLMQGTSGVNDSTLQIGWRSNNNFTFAFWGDDLDTPTPQTDTGWHHWACTFDKDTLTRTIYRDGIAIASDAPYFFSYNGSGPISIAISPALGTWFGGSLEDLRIWSGARSAAQIAAGLNSQLTGNEPGLLANWKFDEGSGNLTADATSGGAGLLVNAPSWLPSGSLLLVSNTISGLLPGTLYHARAVAANAAGSSLGGDISFTTTSSQPVNFNLQRPIKLPGGAFQLTFTNLTGLSFTVLGATNPAMPLSNWTVLGAASEAPPGQYQFTDSQATNNPQRFYRVRSP